MHEKVGIKLSVRYALNNANSNPVSVILACSLHLGHLDLFQGEPLTCCLYEFAVSDIKLEAPFRENLRLHHKL